MLSFQIEKKELGVSVVKKVIREKAPKVLFRDLIKHIKIDDVEKFLKFTECDL